MEDTFSGALPLYQRVRNYLEDLILEGQFEPGDQLPSEKDLQNQFGVSRITVRRALQDLSNEGKIQRVAGKGSFVLKPRRVICVRKSCIQNSQFSVCIDIATQH